MKEKTALNRLGDVFLWLGTALLVVCIAASAIVAYFYIVGTKSYVDQKAVFEVTKSNGEKYEVQGPEGATELDVYGAVLSREIVLDRDGGPFDHIHRSIRKSNVFDQFDKPGDPSRKRIDALLEAERRGLLTQDKLKAVQELRRRKMFPNALPAAQPAGPFDHLIPMTPVEVVKTQEAKRVLTTHHNTEQRLFAILFAGFGLISWLVFASIAYIFNGRSPVAVLKGLLSRA